MPANSSAHDATGYGKSAAGSLRFAAIVFAFYLVAASVGLALIRQSNALAPLWIANVGALAACVRSPQRMAPAIGVAALLGGIVANLLFGVAFALSIILSLANAVEVLIAYALIRRVIGAVCRLSSTRELLVFLATAGLFAPLCSALLAAAGLAIFYDYRPASVILHWFLPDALGMVVLGPLLLTAEREDLVGTHRLRAIVEGVVVIALSAAITYLAFSGTRYPLLFLIFPVLTLAAFRLRFAGTALAMVTVALVASLCTVAGTSTIARLVPDLGGQIIVLQVFLLVATLATLPVAATLADRRAVATTLEESERRYRLLAEHSSDMIVRIGLDGVRRYVSPASLATLGYDPEELIGITPIAVIHPDDRVRVDRACRSLLTGVTNPVCTYRQLHREGHYVWLEAVYRLVRDDVTGEPIEFIATVRDVGARREAELAAAASVAALEESHRLLTMAETLAGIGHWRYDVASGSVYWSDEVYRIRGYLPGTPITYDQVRSGYHADDRDAVTTMIDRSLARGVPWKHQARIVRPDGVVRRIAASGQAERGPDGSIVGLFGVVQDVTDAAAAEAALVAARDEARAAADAKGAFLATMSHEIRTPMTGVLGMVELLRGEPSPADRERYFDNLEQSATLLMTVLDDVLDYSKIESGNLFIEHVPFDLTEVARTTMDLFHNAALRKNLILRFTGANEPLSMIGDPIRLQQVLSNLISNAIKFTEAGEIELGIKVKNLDERRLIRFSIIDSGIGLANEEIALLFEPFVQADTSTTRRFGGTGLGLAITRRLVQAMGGQIGVDSERGVGSTFWFEVPFEIGPAAPHAGDVAAATAVKGRRLSVLVAEDNLVNQTLITALIERNGHHVTCVDNGRLAIEAATRQRFDLILMDMQMPELDGVGATKAIRAGAGPNAATPIVALTADASAERRGLYEGIGLTDFMAKPIDSIRLSRLLAGTASPSDGDDPPPTPPSQSPALLDEGRLAIVKATLGAMQARKLLTMFVEELKTRPATIAGLIKSGELSAAAREAHALRGAALGMGATAIIEVASAIERSDTNSDLQELGIALEHDAIATAAAIKRWIAEIGDD